MATKLKNLRVTKVDFVDEGANPEAHIRLFKSRDGAGEAGERANGKGSGGLRKLLAFIGKAAGMRQEEIDTVVEEIRKENSMSFYDKIHEVNCRKISDEIWDVCYALQASLCSILFDEEMDEGSAAAAMQDSLNEFCGVAEDAIQRWSEKKTADIVSRNEEVTEEDLMMMKESRDRLVKLIEKASSAAAELEKEEELKGDEEEMRIDKSKLTAAEMAFLESIEKRCGMEDGDGQEDAKVLQPGADDVYKGLHPAVKAELEELKKFREAVLEKELQEIAGKYAVIGKKAEELVPVLKGLKAAGGSAYSDYLAVMDEAVELVEKSGAFSEVGRSGHGSFAGGAWEQADAKAVELMKAKRGLSKAQALDEVFLADPELAERCEKEG